MNHSITFNPLQFANRLNAEDLANVKTELKEDIADVRSDIRLLKWMMGFMLAGIASLLAKSFF